MDEEEAWLNEKLAVVSSEETGDTLGAVQELVKKHEAFEADLGTHRERVGKIEREGQRLVEQVRDCVKNFIFVCLMCYCCTQGNHQSDNIHHRLTGAQVSPVKTPTHTQLSL